jgi:hypothetical protein
VHFEGTPPAVARLSALYRPSGAGLTLDGNSQGFRPGLRFCRPSGTYHRRNHLPSSDSALGYVASFLRD